MFASKTQPILYMRYHLLRMLVLRVPQCSGLVWACQMSLHVGAALPAAHVTAEFQTTDARVVADSCADQE